MDARQATLLNDAIGLAQRAHSFQRRKFTNEPYILHPLRVMQAALNGGGTAFDAMVAVLHDVIEDTHETYQSLLVYGMPVAVVSDVVTLSREIEETYVEFITRVIRSPRAARIKRLDVLDNLRTLPPGHSLHDRYYQALRILDEAAT